MIRVIKVKVACFDITTNIASKARYLLIYKLKTLKLQKVILSCLLPTTQIHSFWQYGKNALKLCCHTH